MAFTRSHQWSPVLSQKNPIHIHTPYSIVNSDVFNTAAKWTSTAVTLWRHKVRTWAGRRLSWLMSFVISPILPPQIKVNILIKQWPPCSKLLPVRSIVHPQFVIHPTIWHCRHRETSLERKHSAMYVYRPQVLAPFPSGIPNQNEFLISCIHATLPVQFTLIIMNTNDAAPDYTKYQEVPVVGAATR